MLTEHGANCTRAAQHIGNSGKDWWRPYQPHPGTQCHRCGCSLPGLTGFTADRCGGTDRAAITLLTIAVSGAIVTACWQLTTASKQLENTLLERPNRMLRLNAKPSDQQCQGIRQIRQMLTGGRALLRVMRRIVG